MLALGYFPRPGGSSTSEPGKAKEEGEEGLQSRRNRFQVVVVPLKKVLSWGVLLLLYCSGKRTRLGIYRSRRSQDRRHRVHTAMITKTLISLGCNVMPSRGKPASGRRWQRRRSSETSPSRLGRLLLLPPVLLLQQFVLLLLLLLGLSPASALLQFAEVPNRITNERTATFTYDCTTLDVAQGDTCEVEVRVFDACTYIILACVYLVQTRHDTTRPWCSSRRLRPRLHKATTATSTTFDYFYNYCCIDACAWFCCTGTIYL